MATYQLCNTGVIRDDGAVIPCDPRNRDYARYLEWLKEGNFPAPAAPEKAAPSDADIAVLTLQRDPVFRALIKVLAAHFNMTPLQLAAEIKAQV